MSSVIRILRYKNLFSKYTYSLAPNIKRNGQIKFFAPMNAVSISSNSRRYTAQDPLESPDLSNSSNRFKQSFSLEADFQFVDSILRRGGFLRKKTIENLLQKVALSKNVTPSQTLFLIRCCGSSASLESTETRNQLVSRIWNTFQEQELPLDISHYNALLQVFVENEHKFLPLDFLATLQEKNVEPNRITYSRLISRYCQVGDIEGANKILEFMKAKEMPINEYIFNSLILGNSRANDLDGAVGIIDLMKKSDLTPDSDTYSVLLQAYAEHKDTDGINKVLAQCHQEDIFINDKSMMDVICVLAEHNLHNHVEEILSNIKKKEGYLSLVQHTVGRLLSAGQDEVAYSLYKTLSFNEDFHYIGNFFPKQLAASNMDLYKVVKYCDELRNNGWNVLAYELAFESYLLESKFDMALGLARVMNEKGVPLKEHYFYPLIFNVAKSNNREQVLNLLEEILPLKVSFETEFLSAVLLPCLNVSDKLHDIESVYMRLSTYQNEINLSEIYNGIVEYLMKRYPLDIAAQFVTRFRRGVKWTLKAFLADIFLNTYNIDATVCILRQMLPLSVRLGRESDDLEMGYSGIKNFLSFIIFGLRKQGVLDEHLLPFLKAMEREGVYIIPSMVEYLTTEIGEAMNSEIQETLEKLCDTSLMQTNSQAISTFQEGDRGSNVMSLRKKIEDAEENGEINVELNIALLIGLIRQKNIQQVETQLHKLQSNGHLLPPPVMVILMDMYLEEKRLDEAEKVFHAAVDENPDFQFSSHKVIKFARALVEQDRYQDAVKCLLMNSNENGNWTAETKPNIEDNFYRNRIVGMLKDVVVKKDLATLKLLQEALISRGFAPPSVVLASLIQYYLQEDDLEEAFSMFEKIASEHNVTPSKELLTIACINKEDTEKIQKIMEISSKIHGDMNTLYDLVFAFLEVGKLKQAEKILQTAGLRTLQMRLNDRCDFYLRTKKTAQLEALVTVTKGLFNVDRQKLYNYLLDAYMREDDTGKALGLWTRMQEENVEPDSHFLFTLGKFLSSKGLQVPFVVPTSVAAEEPAIPRLERRPRLNPNQTRVPSIHHDLLRALDSQNLSEVEEIYNRENKSKVGFSAPIISRIIGIYLRNGKITEAVEEAKRVMLRGDIPSVNILRILLEELGNSGDSATIEFLGKYLNNDMRRKCFYNGKLGAAFVNSGRVEEFINQKVQAVSEAKDINDIREDIITQSTVKLIIKKHPELYSQLENYAEILKKKDFPNLYHTLWEAQFVEGNKAEAEKLYESHLKDSNHLGVRTICSQSLREKDTRRLEEVLEVLNRKPEGRETVKGFVYSCYLEILNKDEKFEEALQVLEKSLQSIKLEHYRVSSLSSLSQSMRKKDLSFPYDISKLRQEASSSSSSSSSSSDDEKK